MRDNTHRYRNQQTRRPLRVRARALAPFPRAFWMAVLFSLLALTTAVRAEDYNHAPFNALLAAYVQGDGVNYDGLAADRARLTAYLEPASTFDPEGLSRDEAMAFWINMYNAWTLELILTKYPDVASIKELGTLFSSPWKKRFVEIGGKTLTLSEIEHAILREKYKDPRIHFAINCASKSCPPLIPEAYRAEALDAQLDAVTGNFINKASNTRITGNRLSVSRIFKWYEDDFGNEITAYIRRYAKGPLKQQLEATGGTLEVSFQPYDWSLNTPETR